MDSAPGHEAKKAASDSVSKSPQQNRAIIQRLADVEREQVKWLWQGRIPIGKITILEGDPEVGKSFVSLALTTAVTTGSGLPAEEPREPAAVLILTAEDGLGDTVRPRAEDMGADLTKVFCLTAVCDDDGNQKHFSLADDLAVLEDQLQLHKIALVIIDPINAYLGGSIDTNKDAALRSVLTPLAALAERYGVAILVIRHLTKGSRDRAIYRGQGSIAYVAAARSVLLVGKNPTDESERVVVCIKNNLAAHPAGIAFEIVEGQFRWKGETTLTAEDLLRPDATEGTSAIDGAIQFLKEALRDGARPAKDVEKEGRSEGIGIGTLRRARETLGVKSSRIGEAGKQGGGVWLWSLPAGPEPPSGLDAQDAQVNNLITLTLPESESGTEEPGDEHLNPDDHLEDDGPEGCEECAEPVNPGERYCRRCASARSPAARWALEAGAQLVMDCPAWVVVDRS